MAGCALQYQIADGDSVGEVISALSSEFCMGNESRKVLRRTFYDTFDWRVFLSGGELLEERSGKQRSLIWRSLEDGAVKETLRFTGSVPNFAWDFQPGIMQSLLTPAIAMRALLHQVEVKTQVRTLRLFDREEKTVLRLVMEENSGRFPGKGDFVPLPSRINLVPVRGYPKPLERVEEFLTETLGIKSGAASMLEAAMNALGSKPVNYSSKLNFHFEPKMRAVAVARAIHLRLLDIIEINIPGTRTDLDSEFLHDLRVAVRRTRSVLAQVKDVFPIDVVERFKESFSWVGKITGPTRDMHVYLLGFDKFRESLPEQFREDVEPLKAFLIAHQKSEHRAMSRKIDSPHFRGILEQWRSYLESPLPERPGVPNADRRVAEVAGKRIFRIYQRVLREGLAIIPTSPADDLHELRKSCKKLRYLLEFFQSLYPGNQVRPLIKTLKVLLDNLGDYQDMEVQAYKLREFAHQMVKEGEVKADTLLAVGMLVDGLLESQRLAREEFAARFALFSEVGGRAVYQALFAPMKKKVKKA
ncbi:CHAD domain-containing protein [Candidatus Vondammii sp. HM_W22]|uniref:CHAD domain-containing protein n=1 Tax=Candidatus Vondammii sp. HM_W22 TaxID=2687299 RepID=UPI001F134D13|nr:CHAD domain-containing protein [Candidatus Vondammii sp. HM_W22]